MSHLSILKALWRIEIIINLKLEVQLSKISCLSFFCDANGKANLFGNFGVSIQNLAERNEVIKSNIEKRYYTKASLKLGVHY